MIHLYRLPLDLPPAEIHVLAQTLTPDEAQRAARYLMEEARTRFIAARGQLRQVLSHWQECSPSEIRFDTLPNGKPYLLACASETPDGRMFKRQGISFNLSHSADLALLAVDETGARELGIDLELRRGDVPFLSLAHRFFAERETAFLASLPAADQLPAFYRLWTRKGALLKLTGIGIAGGLNRYEIPLGPEPLVTVENWTLLDLHAAPDFSAALAVDGELPEIRWDELPR